MWRAWNWIRGNAPGTPPSQQPPLQERAQPPQQPSPPWWKQGVQQDALEPLPSNQDRYGYGPADNGKVIGALGIVGAGLQPLFTLNLNVYPFTQAVGDASNLEFIDYLLISSLVSLRLNRQQDRRQQIIAEVLSPFMLETSALSQADAQTSVQQTVDNTVSLAGAPWFNDAVQALDPAVVNQYWDRQTNTWEAGFTLRQKLHFLRMLMAVMPVCATARALVPVLLALLGFALKGEITTQKLARFVTRLEITVPAISEVTREEIALTWNNFGHLANDKSVACIFRRWLEFLPLHAIRLRMCIAQAAGSGLTCLDVIATCIHKHPQGPWYRVNRLYPDEWKAAVAAMQAIGNNPYYGYRTDFSKVRSTLYRNISWISKEVLIRLGDKTLGNYRGFAGAPTHADMAEKIVKEFVAQSASTVDLTPAEGWETLHMQDLIDHVRQYPSNIPETVSMAGHADPTVQWATNAVDPQAQANAPGQPYHSSAVGQGGAVGGPPLALPQAPLAPLAPGQGNP